PRCRVGAGGVRSSHHRLGGGARLREGVKQRGSALCACGTSFAGFWARRPPTNCNSDRTNRKSIMTVIKCISPVDGSVYAEREAMPLAAAQEVVARAKKAQKAWAKRPLEDRIQLVLKGVARVNEMADEIVPEIA